MSRQSSGLTSREAGRLSDLLLKWAETDTGLLDGSDRDAIGRLRHLLEEAEQ